MSDIRVIDGITPEVDRMLREINNREPIMRAAGQEVVSITRQAFTNASLRPATWAPLKGKSGRALYRTGALTRSIAVTSVDDNHVVVSTDRPYAAFHQFGTKGPYTIRARLGGGLFWPGAKHPVKSVQHPGLPARPFFPFTLSGSIASFARIRISNIIASKIARILRIS